MIHRPILFKEIVQQILFSVFAGHTSAVKEVPKSEESEDALPPVEEVPGKKGKAVL